MGWTFRAFIPTRGAKAKCVSCKRAIEYVDPCVRHVYIEKSGYMLPTRDQYHCYFSCLQKMKESHMELFLQKYWTEPEVVEVRNAIIKARKQK